MKCQKTGDKTRKLWKFMCVWQSRSVYLSLSLTLIVSSSCCRCCQPNQIIHTHPMPILLSYCLLFSSIKYPCPVISSLTFQNLFFSPCFSGNYPPVWRLRPHSPLPPFPHSHSPRHLVTVPPFPSHSSRGKMRRRQPAKRQKLQPNDGECHTLLYLVWWWSNRNAFLLQICR